MPHWLKTVIEIFEAPTSDLRELAHLAGGDPRTFYRGVNLSDLDTKGQNIDDMQFSNQAPQVPDSGTHVPKTRRRRRKPSANDLIGVLESLDVRNLSLAEKADLKRKLGLHKKQMAAAVTVIDGHLKKLARKKRNVRKPNPAPRKKATKR